MPLGTRPRVTASQELTEIHDSDSEQEVQQIKRQKVDHHKTASAKMIAGPAPVASLATKNSNLKGRKRFNADLEDLKAACTQGFVAHGLKLTKIRSGDDEGSFEATIKTTTGQHVLNLNIMISDTSDYPKSHNCFSYSPDSNLSSNIQDVVENIVSFDPRSLAETMEKVLAKLAKAMNTGTAQSDDEIEEDDGDEEDYAGAYDEDDYIGGGTSRNQIQMGAMQRDFVDIVGSLYRPGLIRFGGDDFCISVSLSVVKLAESIPAQALMAWDRRLLSKSQHLVLLISGFHGAYPPSASTKLAFHVGLSGAYKPSNMHAREACRNFGLITSDAEDEVRIALEKQAAEAALAGWDPDDEDSVMTPEPEAQPEEEEEEEEDAGRFDKFSLSSSLESLMNQSFTKLVEIRRKYKLGWAGAELLLSEVEKSQKPHEHVLNAKRKEIKREDVAERELMRSTVLPHDPLHGLGINDEVNWPLTAFSYLIRRVTLCSRFCIVCHNKLNTDYVALKPYVCDSKLCHYQYYSLNRGPSLEYEIVHNPETIDLLVSITYSAACEGTLDEPLPTGMGLRVPMPDTSKVLTPPTNRYIGGITAPAPATPEPSTQPVLDNNKLCEFDELSKMQMRASVAQLIDSLPPIHDMKKHLERQVQPGKSKPKLKTMDSNILPAAWQILRWCVGSCTAYLEEITTPEESIKTIDPSWRQYRFSVGAPDAEAKFKSALESAQKENANAQQYPSLYGFHGSPVRNWHSIIRNGLWAKTIANGRAFGNGVYLAKDGSVSMHSYASGNRAGPWRKSKIAPSSCVALVEAVNLPHKFVSINPHFVVDNTSWLVCRYLLVKTSLTAEEPAAKARKPNKNVAATPFVRLDPAHTLTLGQNAIQIPDPTFQLEILLRDRKSEDVDENPDTEDQQVFEYTETDKGKGKEKDDPMIIDDDEMDYEMAGASHSHNPAASASSAPAVKRPLSRPADDWAHDAEYVRKAIAQVMPPPTSASRGATMAVQKELKAMLKEQKNCSSFKELGWYLPEEFITDNLFQWVVEMHSFDPDLPIAQDLKAKNINSIIFEIRFPPEFPLSPPFFRIITPRFLPFIQGGGGHVTGGGSICMDLLTASGWLPSYNIASVLLQIKLAISNLDPRPARLAPNWNSPYGVSESLVGFKRAAATHQWQLPAGIDSLVR